MEFLEFSLIVYAAIGVAELKLEIRATENKVNNANHLYYDEQNNEISYSDHVIVIDLNSNSYMANVAEMNEKESQVMALGCPTTITAQKIYFCKTKLRHFHTLTPEIAVVCICPPNP